METNVFGLKGKRLKLSISWTNEVGVAMWHSQTPCGRHCHRATHSSGTHHGMHADLTTPVGQRLLHCVRCPSLLQPRGPHTAWSEPSPPGSSPLVTDRHWWSFALGGAICERFCSVSHVFQGDWAPVAASGNFLHNAAFIGSLPFFGSLPQPLTDTWILISEYTSGETQFKMLSFKWHYVRTGLLNGLNEIIGVMIFKHQTTTAECKWWKISPTQHVRPKNQPKLLLNTDGAPILIQTAMFSLQGVWNFSVHPPPSLCFPPCHPVLFSS